MEGHGTVFGYAANRGGSCINEELNDAGCYIWIVARNMEWQTPIISSTGSSRKILEKISNYFLSNPFIVACLKEEFIIAHMNIIWCQSMSCN
eukprot:scaffold1837_cov124-Skeletonema_menzelii.AAC.8